MRTVAVLFARQDSVYKTMPGCDVWDIERDARNWPGGAPVVAHPPCRAWGRLHYFAKPREDEKVLGLLAVDLVRKWGGVLEHPAYSSLWLYRCLPAPGVYDEYGGTTIPIRQFWFGHRADKATWLYVVGAALRDVPQMPLVLGRAPMSVSPGGGMRKGDPYWRPSIRKDEREHTPPQVSCLARRAGAALQR